MCPGTTPPPGRGAQVKVTPGNLARVAGRRATPQARAQHRWDRRQQAPNPGLTVNNHVHDAKTHTHRYTDTYSLRHKDTFTQIQRHAHRDKITVQGAIKTKG